MIKKKHRAWQRYIETRDQKKYRDYTKLRNKVRAMTRKLQKDKERNISSNIKTNPKKFWSYVNNRLKTSNTIPALVTKMTEDNLEILTNSNKEKSEVLSDYFASVFTYEPESLPLESELFTVESTLKDIEITSDDVKKTT